MILSFKWHEYRGGQYQLVNDLVWTALFKWYTDRGGWRESCGKKQVDYGEMQPCSTCFSYSFFIHIPNSCLYNQAANGKTDTHVDTGKQHTDSDIAVFKLL